MRHAEFSATMAVARPITISLHEMFIVPGEPIAAVVFPETGFISMTTTGSDKVEVGMIGFEGGVGLSPLLLGSDISSFNHFTQSPGRAILVPAADLLAICDRFPELRARFLRFILTLEVQTAHTALANALYSVEVRLARWLMMCQDRLDSDELLITHEFLATMLGVQRTSVTVSLQMLEGHLAIRARRGRIEVRDRETLRRIAGAGYGAAEAEYARLFEDMASTHLGTDKAAIAV